jgi:agmatinase
MIDSVINTEASREADLVFVSAPYERTASSHKGTREGPAKIVDCLHNQIEFFDRNFKVKVNDFVKSAHLDLGDLNSLSPEINMEKIKEKTGELISKGKFVFLLGGEHAVSVGYLSALAEKYNPKEVTILHIDAHCDLRNDDSDYSETPSTLAHSTVMRRASEMGYPLVQVGIRTYHESEYAYFGDKKNNVTVFEWNKAPASIKEVLKAIRTKYIYLSIDVDGFDPSVMPGTGTPVAGGLSWYYGVELIEEAIKAHELVGCDIVEVSPMPGSVQTEYNAAQLAYTIIANKFRDRF